MKNDSLAVKKNNRGTLGILLFIAALLILVIVLENTMKPTSMLFTVIKKGSVYALVACSMNLLNGFTGLFSLGQAGFMLLGAYGYAILTIPTSARNMVYYLYEGSAINFSLQEVFGGGAFGLILGVLLALIVSGLVAAGVAWLIGLPVLRLKSDYLAIATLGFAEILRAFVQWDKLGPLTNSSNLLRGYPEFQSITAYLIIIGLFITVVVLLVNSTYGRAFIAIRDDEVAAEAMGINLAKHKRMAFVISSFFAGIGGGMLAMYMGAVQALSFRSSMTYEILLIVVIGGIGSITGSIFTSFVYVASVEWLLRGLDSGVFLGISAPGIFKNGFRMAVVSVLIMAVVLFFRKGIMGDKELPDLLRKRPRKAKKKEAAK